MSTSFYEHVMGVNGLAPEAIQPGKLHRYGPKQAAWCKLFDDELAGVCGYWGRIEKSTWFATDRTKLTPAQSAFYMRQAALAAHERELEQQAKYRANAGYIADLLGASKPATAGDPIARYFELRGIAGAWKCAPCLRLAERLVYRHEGRQVGVFPAMLAPLVSAGGEVVAVHRTFLTDEGRKADVPAVKKLTPAAGSVRGAAIRLQSPQDGVLGVAEGIETAVAASMGSGVPTWSTYSGGGLASFAWPKGVRKLIVFGDADDAGRKAATALRDRATTHGLACSILYPSTEGQDWLDVYVGAKS
jgi:putative DNA primase/helicase